MDCSPLAMAFKDPDMKLIPLPPVGVEYRRLQSPPPSDHSSQEDKDDRKIENGKKRIRMTPEVYLEIRNRNVANYLNKLREHPSTIYEDCLAKLWQQRNTRLRLLKGKAFKPEVMKKEIDEEFGCSSDTSQETNSSFPRNIGRVQQHDFQVQCYRSMVDQRKQQKNGVLFSHANFQMILEAQWSLIKVKRLEQIFEGVALGCRVDPKWIDFENEIQKCYGPMDVDSMEFMQLFVAFQMQRWEMIIKMFEEESEMLEKMVKEKRVPSEFPQQLAALRQTRSILEARISAMSELQCDQNPYTNPNNMDFWVMPRPKQTTEVYTIRNEETDKFLEFNLLLDGKGAPKMDSKDQNHLFARKCYNTAVFDVGWHYSPVKVLWDIPQNNRNNFDAEKWTSRMLEVRGDLMKFNPFGHEVADFYKLVRNKYQIREGDTIFSGMVDQSCILDLVFPQILLSRGDGANRVILFDGLFEGVVATPVEMLLRIWTRIRFLIDEQPSQLLPLKDFQRIYEKCFGQKFYPLQWGFKDVEGFFQNVRQYLPQEISEDVIIVTKDERELEKMMLMLGYRQKLMQSGPAF